MQMTRVLVSASWRRTTMAKSLRVHLSETVRLAGPLAAAQLTTFMMGVVDVACVGRYSEVALGAVGVANALIWGCSSLVLGLPLALDPLVSQSVGQNNPVRAYQWLKQGVIATTLVTIPICLLAVIGCGSLTAFGIPENLSDEAFEYAIYRAPSLIFFNAFLAAKSYLQSHEVTRPILFSALLANIINLVLNIILIYGDRALVAIGLPEIGLPPLGVVGAGITTTVSSFALAAFLFRDVYKLRPNREKRAVPPPSMRKLFGLAWPISLQQIGESWLFSGFGVLAGRFGEVAAGAHQVALTLCACAFMLALGLSSATSVRVGHAVGANEQQDVRRAAIAGLILVLMIMGSTSTLFLLFPESLVELLTNERNVSNIAASLLAYGAAFALFDGVQVVIGGALRGAGDVRIPSILSFMTYWGVGGTVGLIAMNTPLELTGIWLGLCAGLMSASVVLSYRFFWVTRRPIIAVET